MESDFCLQPNFDFSDLAFDSTCCEFGQIIHKWDFESCLQGDFCAWDIKIDQYSNDTFITKLRTKDKQIVVVTRVWMFLHKRYGMFPQLVEMIAGQQHVKWRAIWFKLLHTNLVKFGFAKLWPNSQFWLSISFQPDSTKWRPHELGNLLTISCTHTL